MNDREGDQERSDDTSEVLIVVGTSATDQSADQGKGKPNGIGTKHKKGERYFIPGQECAQLDFPAGIESLPP